MATLKFCNQEITKKGSPCRLLPKVSNWGLPCTKQVIAGGPGCCRDVVGRAEAVVFGRVVRDSRKLASPPSLRQTMAGQHLVNYARKVEASGSRDLRRFS